jgi:hypothetical protein
LRICPRDKEGVVSSQIDMDLTPRMAGRPAGRRRITGGCVRGVRATERMRIGEYGYRQLHRLCEWRCLSSSLCRDFYFRKLEILVANHAEIVERVVKIEILG